MREPRAAFGSEIAHQLDLPRERQHIGVKPRAEQHLGRDILRRAMRFGLGENLGEAVENLQEGGNGSVVKGHEGLSFVLLTTSPSPRLRGRDERSSLLEGWGEGGSPQARLADNPPHPALTRADLSPQAGRGDTNSGASVYRPASAPAVCPRTPPRIRVSNSAVGQESAGKPNLICIAFTALRLCWPITPSTLPTLKPARTNNCCSSRNSLRGSCATAAVGRCIGAAPLMRVTR